MAIYPETIQSLLNDCESYRKRKIDLDELKSKVWHASRVVVALEELELQRFLMSSEGELDSIQYTTDADRIFERTLVIVESLEAALRANLAK